MIRLRRCAASAGHVRLRNFVASAGLVRSSSAFAPVRATSRWVERAIMTALLVSIWGSSPVFACPMCFGAEETSMLDGTKLGIAVMLGITFAVQGAFAGFFFYLRRRAKRIADLDLDSEWAELQRSKT